VIEKVVSDSDEVDVVRQTCVKRTAGWDRWNLEEGYTGQDNLLA